MDTSWQALENNAILRVGPCRSEGRGPAGSLKAFDFFDEGIDPVYEL
jgi:hypothetical protein